MQSRNRAEFWSVVLLRFGACLTMLAFAAMVMPTSWMEETHRQLGLGEFPDTPLVQYLTRSISALYGFHGVFLWIVSTNVRRFRPLVYFIALMDIIFGLMLLVIDLYSGMPAFWTMSEGPGLILVGGILLLLGRGIRSTEAGP